MPALLACIPRARRRTWRAAVARRSAIAPTIGSTVRSSSTVSTDRPGTLAIQREACERS